MSNGPRSSRLDGEFGVARDGLKIAVVGDIDAESVGTLLDRTFGALPAKGKLQPVPYAVPQALGRRIVTTTEPFDVEGTATEYDEPARRLER